MDLKETRSKFFDYSSVHPWEIVRLEFAEQILKNYAPEAINLIDFGCGNCYVANKLEKDIGMEITAIDNAFSDDLLNALRKKTSGRNIRLARNIDETFVPDNYYDVILLMDVLEHIEIDHNLLQDLVSNKKIKPGAVFVITVPAFSLLYSRHDRLLGHWRRYTRRRICRLAEDCGAEVIDSGYIFSLLLIPRFISLLIQKIFHRHDLLDESTVAVGEWNRGATLTAIIAFILKADIFVGQLLNKLKIRIPGLSCYLVCRKPH
ncbi:MAG: methyltransferase domain-containing protein [Victivallaceae bacterium]